MPKMMRTIRVVAVLAFVFALFVRAGVCADDALYSRPGGCADDALYSRPGGLHTGGSDTITLPLIGELKESEHSLPVLTLIVAVVDGFNPCAFFVLLFLLSLIMHARSRGRILLIGGMFVFASGLVYFLFMSAWLNLFLVAGSIAWITTAAGLLALVFALVNVKDYFFFGIGVSLSIPESAKPTLFRRMRGLVRSTSLVSVMAGTVALAFSANAYELLCTAGFPMLYTRVLSVSGLTAGGRYLYMALYCMVYVVPLATVVVIFSRTLGGRKLTEAQGRVLKLVSGSMMLMMGLVLLVNPSLLASAFAAVAILAGALLLSGLVVLVTRKRM